MDITTLEMLREHYAEPKERAVRKEIRALDVHCRRLIGLSPFLILATSDKNHNMDASPRGGVPGFVKVTADGAVLIPDAPVTTGSIRSPTSLRPAKSAFCS
jgi:predicted pyridoxine 5'-phosphate oxidase superfamily flavin-nucleotide-binding protein